MHGYNTTDHNITGTYYCPSLNLIMFAASLRMIYIYTITMPHQWLTLLLKFVTIVLRVCTQQNTQICKILIVHTCVRWNLIYIKGTD